MLAIRARKLWLVAVVLLLTGSNGFVQFYKNCRVHRSLSMKLDPKSPKDNIQEQIRLNSKLLLQQLLLYGVIQSRPANAIGKLSEFSKQTMVIQDLLFNVQDAEKESEMMMALFQNTAKTIRSSTNSGEKKVVVAFGADAFDSPPNFFPGISNFLEAGGHATLSFRSKSVGDESEIFEKGNGLQFIKIGSELIRLSKGIEKGAQVGYGYGYVDLETPGGVPLEVILGIARDPVMMACIRVRDMRESLQFFIEKLGMTVLQFPLARTPGSQFEPDQPKGSTCIGYGDDSLKLLLIPSGPKDPPIQIGSMLQGITIVFDDSSDTLPAAAQGVSKQSPTTIYSPDGYPIILKPYTMFEKEATKEVPII